VVYHAAGYAITHCDRVADRCDREPGLHPRADRIDDDPTGEHVFDRAEIQRPRTGVVLGDMSEPQPVRPVRSELVTFPPVLVDDDAVSVIDSRPRRSPYYTAFPAEHAPPAIG
jgi:hypothetical protein